MKSIVCGPVVSACHELQSTTGAVLMAYGSFT